MTNPSYTIEYAESVEADLAALHPRERNRVLDVIDKQLTYEPTHKTRNRKTLQGLIPPWEHVEPIWELRIGEYRVFYDVDAATRTVSVRAVRHKPPHKTTEEIL